MSFGEKHEGAAVLVMLGKACRARSPVVLVGRANASEVQSAFWVLRTG